LSHWPETGNVKKQVGQICLDSSARDADDCRFARNLAAATCFVRVARMPEAACAIQTD
jgi:hypothetical protein